MSLARAFILFTSTLSIALPATIALAESGVAPSPDVYGTEAVCIGDQGEDLGACTFVDDCMEPGSRCYVLQGAACNDLGLQCRSGFECLDGACVHELESYEQYAGTEPPPDTRDSGTAMVDPDGGVIAPPVDASIDVDGETPLGSTFDGGEPKEAGQADESSDTDAGVPKNEAASCSTAIGRPATGSLFAWVFALAWLMSRRARRSRVYIG